MKIKGAANIFKCIISLSFIVALTVSVNAQSLVPSKEELNFSKLSVDKIQLFPNPFIDDLNIQLPINHPYKELEIIDLSGSIVYSREITNSKFKINTELNPGIYFLSFTGVDSNKIIKVIKQ